jgi:hypothetical protein
VPRRSGSGDLSCAAGALRKDWRRRGATAGGWPVHGLASGAMEARLAAACLGVLVAPWWRGWQCRATYCVRLLRRGAPAEPVESASRSLVGFGE